jgi:signal transduction histidine kinase
LLLRGSLRATVQQLQAATDAVARGDFRHRVASGRSDELGELAASIDVMAERLERLEQARRRMLACVSHELRTPLTIIQGYAFTLARHEPDVVRRERLDLVQAEATRLAGLIGDLVEAASLHAGGVRLRVERCDLVELVRDDVERFREEASIRGLMLRIDAPPRQVPADVDPARIGQVLTNLLANAVRHATPGTDISVSVDAPRGGPCRIVVENRCEPMSDDVIEHAFEPFVQGAARTGSVGLGLAIVHAIVLAHGGHVRLDVDAARGGIARFTVELPHAPRLAAGARTRRARRRSAVVPRLVVER